MGNKFKTAGGKTIDIDNLRLQNEKTIAVGNMKVNARGDQLGRGGEIITPKSQVMTQQYPKMQSPIATEEVAQPTIANIAPDGESFDPPEEVIQPLEPKLRGSLADSIAKKATVTQETLDPKMYQPKGPQRI
jgi:hypothetical protein